MDVMTNITKSKILIVGCGEHARMVIDNIEQNNKYEVFGLVTNIEAELNTLVMGYPVVCLENDLESYLRNNPQIEGYFLGVGVKSMKLRWKIYSQIDKLLPAVNIIHPTCIISDHAEFGTGNIFEAFTKIANGVKIGNHCILNSFSAINHDQEIGDNVLIACNVSMAGKKIGSHTIIADGASIAFKKSVGKNCIIGDGTLIHKDIPDNSIVVGNPPRIIRENPW